MRWLVIIGVLVSSVAFGQDENEKKLVDDYTASLIGTWRIFSPELGLTQDVGAPLGKIEDEMSLSFTPKDSVICFKDDGSYWVNIESNNGVFEVVDTVGSFQFIVTTGDTIIHWTFKLRLQKDEYHTGQSEGQLQIFRRYDNWSWAQNLIRSK